MKYQELITYLETILRNNWELHYNIQEIKMSDDIPHIRLMNGRLILQVWVETEKGWFARIQ
jgi:hypothetical protein